MANVEDKILLDTINKINSKIIKDTKNIFQSYKNLVRIGAKYAEKIKDFNEGKITGEDLELWVKALFHCNNQIIKLYSGNIDLRVYIATENNSGDKENNDAINYEEFYQINFTDFIFIRDHLEFSKEKGFIFSPKGLTLGSKDLTAKKGRSKADKLSDTLYEITSHLTGYLRYLYNNPGDIKHEEGIEITALKNSKGKAAYKMYGKRRHYKAKVTYSNINATEDYINFKFSSQKDKESIIHPYYSETENQKGSYFSYAWLREHSLEIGRQNVNLVNSEGEIEKEDLYNLVRQTFLQKMDHVPAARIGDVPGKRKETEDSKAKVGSTQVKAERYDLMSYNQITQMADAFIEMKNYITSDKKFEQLIEIYYNQNTNFQMNWGSLTKIIKDVREQKIEEGINKILEKISTTDKDVYKKELLGILKQKP